MQARSISASQLNVPSNKHTILHSDLLRDVNSPLERTYSDSSKKIDAKVPKTKSLKLKFPELSDNEDIINDFSCALKKDILVHGRMFIGIENFYFYASILGYETKISQKWPNVLSVTKAKLAHIIPNAIKVVTTDGKFTFASFSYRAYPYELMQFAIRNFKDELSMSACEIRETVKSNLLKSSDKPSPSLLSPLDKSCYSLSGDTTSLNIDHRELMSGHSPLKSATEEPISHDNFDSDVSDVKIPYGHLSHHGAFNAVSHRKTHHIGSCCCHHLSVEIVHKLFPMNIDDIFNALYDEHSTVMSKVASKLSMQDYKINTISRNPDGSVTRESSHTLPKAFMGKSAKNKLIEVFPITNEPNIHYQIMGRAFSEGVPYSDSFEVITNTCLLSKSPEHTLYKVSLEIKYKKSLWGVTRQAIEKQAQKTTTSVINECVGEISRLYGDATEANGAPSAFLGTSQSIGAKNTVKGATATQDRSQSMTRIGRILPFLIRLLFFVLLATLMAIVVFQKMRILFLERELYSCKFVSSISPSNPSG